MKRPRQAAVVSRLRSEGCSRELSGVIAPSPMFAALLPKGVIVYEASQHLEDIQSLFGAEATQLAHAREPRRREFATGRACAREALAALGVTRSPLPIGPGRAPVWPDRVVGSITHTKTYCAAAVATREAFLGIGIDAEISARIARNEWRQLFTPEETSWLAAQPVHLQPDLAMSMFCAKEAFFKCQFPLTGGWLDFTDISVRLEGVCYEVRANRPLPIERMAPRPFVGMHGKTNDLVAAAMVMRRP